MNWAYPLTSVALGLAISLQATLPAHAADFRTRVSTTTLSAEGLVDDVKAEIEFGRDVAARIMSLHAPEKDDSLTRYVNLVGNAVAMHDSRGELEYRFAIVDTRSINAYAAPGGFIFVTRGALDLMEDEAELAAVLAHEVAHINQRHIVKELNIRGTEKTAESGLSRLIGGMGDPARAAFSQAVDRAVETLFEAGLKQEDEFEADRVGTIMLASTGYDPTALARYLKKVAAQKGNSLSVLNATHPPFDKRLAALNTLLAEEKLISAKRPQLAERFNNMTRTQRKSNP